MRTSSSSVSRRHRSYRIRRHLRLRLLFGLLLFLLLALRAHAIHLVLIHRVQRAAFRNRNLAVQCLPDNCIARHAEKQFLRIPLHGRELGQPRLQVGLVDGRRMQLLVEPLVQPLRAHRVHIARPRPKSEAVQRMQNPRIAL